MIDLNPLPSRVSRPDSLDDDTEAFFTKLPVFGQDLIALQANVVANASGGAFSLAYSVDTTSTANGDPTNGKIRFNNASVVAATELYIDTVTAGGASVAATLAQLGASSSAIKSTLRLAQANDASKYVIYHVTGYSAQAGYGIATVQHVESSGVAPFVNAALIGLFVDRTGDKGETGPTQMFSYMKVSDRKPSGTNGGASTVSTTFTRTLNTVELNSIAGASLSANAVTLPAGTYDIKARAPSANSGGHSASLFNVTDNVTALNGSSAYSQSTGGTATPATVTGRFTIGAPKAFSLRHYTAGADSVGLGPAVTQTGVQEIYSELEIWKVG